MVQHQSNHTHTVKSVKYYKIVLGMQKHDFTYCEQSLCVSCFQCRHTHSTSKSKHVCVAHAENIISHSHAHKLESRECIQTITYSILTWRQTSLLATNVTFKNCLYYAKVIRCHRRRENSSKFLFLAKYIKQQTSTTTTISLIKINQTHKISTDIHTRNMSFREVERTKWKWNQHESKEIKTWKTTKCGNGIA